MPRQISDELLTALSEPLVNPCIFVSITFKNETVNIWSGLGTQVFNGLTFTGLGPLMTLSTPEEGYTVQARGMTLTVSGIDPVFLPDVKDNLQLGAPVTVWLGLKDPSSGELIDEPAIAFQGCVDQPSFVIGEKDIAIEIALESRLISMNTSIDRRLTNDDLQLTTPGDLGLMFVAGLQNQVLMWGSPIRNDSI